MKLTDLDRSELEASDNLFATIVLAHLETQASHGDARTRKDSKFALLRRMYERGMSADAIRLVFRVIDRMMSLGRTLERAFWLDVKKFEQEHSMTYITSVERIGIEQGVEQGIGQGLQRGIERIFRQRFEDEASVLMTYVQTIHGEDRLNEVFDAALEVQSPSDFLSAVAKLTKTS